MATRLSSFLGLVLEDNNEFCGIEQTADNFEAIDEYAGQTESALAALNNPEFAIATTLAEPQSGESHTTVFGKLKKAVRMLLAHVNASGSHDAATQSAAGYMSAEDKTKLDGIAPNANNYTYTHPTFTAKSSGIYKITTNAEGHVTAAVPVQKSDLEEYIEYPDPEEYKMLDACNLNITVPAGAKSATAWTPNFDRIGANANIIYVVAGLNAAGLITYGTVIKNVRAVDTVKENGKWKAQIKAELSQTQAEALTVHVTCIACAY